VSGSARSRPQGDGRLAALLDSGTAIAVVGMAGRFPGAPDVRRFWRNVREGVESIRALDEAELDAAGVPRNVREDPRFVPVAAVLDGMDRFDARFFGFSPRDAAILDPQHRHFLETAWAALEDAGHVPERFPGAIGVFAGSGANAYLWTNLLTNPDLVRDVGFFLLRHTGNDKDFLATRVSYELNLTGPSVNVQTACSTSLVAVHVAAQSLLSGECDMALAGGVSIEHPHGVGYLYREGEILSPDGRCRAFDAAAAGTVFGSGVGAVVLRRLEDALTDGDSIHAVILGTAVNNDGAMKVGYLAPGVEGQARAIAEALGVSDASPDSLGYVEAHGTGTPVGDPIEVAALTQAFRTGTDRTGYCALGSVKPNVGHLDTAAGVAGLIKAVCALKEGVLPPTLHYREPNPAIDLASSPFHVPAEAAPWEARGPRRAGVSSLGVGGTNAFAVLEEAPDVPAPSGTARSVQLLLLSGRTRTALEAVSADLAEHLEAERAPPLSDVGFTLALGRRAFSHRRAVVASAAGEVVEALAAGDPERVVTGEAPEGPTPVSFLFGGGGSQYPGMGAGLHREEPVYREVVEECLALLDAEAAAGVRTLLSAEAPAVGARPEGERPGVALPALFITQLAQARLWRSWGVEPTAMIGHSMGEYTAACLSGVFTVRDALALVMLRARLFEQVPEGGMLGVNLSEGELRHRLPPDLSVAAVNAPELTVASGPIPALGRLEAALDREEIGFRRIHISVAAHSAMLDPVLEEFRTEIDGLEIGTPRIPFVSNLSGDWITEAEARDPGYWVRQLRETVRFSDGVARLAADRPGVLLEVGPGRTLATLARMSPETAGRHVLSSMEHPDRRDGESSRGDLAFQLGSLGRLWSLGVEVDWAAFHRGRGGSRVSLPTYPFEGERHWIEPGPGVPSSANEPSREAGPDAEAARDGAAARGDAEAGGRAAPRDDAAGPGPFWEGHWEPAPLPTAQAEAAPPGGTRGPILVLGRGTAGEERLREALSRVGVPVVAVILDADGVEEAGTREPGPFRIRAGELDDLRRVVRRVHEATGTPPGGALHLPLLEGGAPCLDAAFHTLLDLVRVLAENEPEGDFPLVVPGSGLLRVHADDPVEPRKSVVLGPVRVAPREFPWLRARAVDLPAELLARPDEVARILAGELDAGGPDRVVVHRGGRRLVERFRPVALDGGEGRPTLEADGSYLVTGGLGELGLAAARRLGELGAGGVILVGRTGLPPREAWDDHLARRPETDRTARRIRAVREIEATGCRVEVHAVDVTDASALARVVATGSERLGALRGVVHAAGILDDAPILLKDREAAERVLAPKLAGTEALDRALEGRPLDFRILFSSTSAVTGLAGQVDYTAANAFLDAWAQHASGAQGRGRTVAVRWDAWREVGMAVEHFRRQSSGTAPGTGEEALDHPLFSGRERSGEEASYQATFREGSHWMLDEHRLRDGPPLVPGAGFLELLRAAFELETGRGTARLEDVLFLEPFVVPRGTARRMRVRLRPAGDGFDAVVLGRPTDPEVEGWTEHVRARLVPSAQEALPGAEAGSPAAPPGGDRPGGAPGWECRPVGGRPPNPRLDFGPRWANLAEVRTRQGKGPREAVLALQLPEPFHPDAERHPLHPALADVALAGGQSLIPGFDPESDFFIPASCARFELWAPIPVRCFSHLRLRDHEIDGMAVFDVSILDERGRVAARAEEFVMLRLDDPGRLGAAGGEGADGAPAPASAAGPLPEPALDEGLTTEEGLAALERILAAPACPPVVTVVPRDLPALLARLDEPEGPGSPGPAAEGGGEPVDAVDVRPLVQALLEHPAVDDAAAVAHELRGGRVRVVAFTAFGDGAPATVSELRRFLRDRVPDELVPGSFVEVPRVPRAPDGSVDRPALPDPFAPTDDHVAPRTPTERAIAEVWSRLLGIDRVGVHDNFLDVGGHSLVGIRALLQIEKHTGVRLHPNALTLQTVEQLAAEIDRRRKGEDEGGRGSRGLAGRILDAVRGSGD
jgi:acyl transferase domain-containing protein/NAD(P)-dependent dehydrogenase (short-subunit alcohol dehydrogenase family)